MKDVNVKNIENFAQVLFQGKQQDHIYATAKDKCARKYRFT